VRHFACAVHGTIEANALECVVIDNPMFQRLRKIKQLGNTHTVFPGATHTRFAHSLGVMHMAGQLFDGATSSFVSLQKSVDLQMSQCLKSVRQSLRLAALLHDLGHGPYSHHFENLLVKDGKPLVYAQWPSLDLKIPEDWIDSGRLEEFQNEHLHHEHFTYGLVLAYSKLKIEGFDAQGILSLLDNRIKPSTKLQSELETLAESEGAEAFAWKSLHACLKSFLSSEIDADRMDYLQRDALNAGVTIGLDLRHLLHSIRIVYDDALQRFVIEVKTNAVTVIEQILIARKQMFDQVYQHRVTLQFDDLLKQALLYWMKLHHKQPPHSLATFMPLSDDRVDEELTKLLADSQVTNESNERLALKMFLTRTTPVLLEEILASTDEEVRYIVSESKKKYGDNVRIHVVNLKAFFRADRNTEDSTKDTLFVISSRSKTGQTSGQRTPLRLFSEVLQSTAWSQSSIKILITKDLKTSASERKLAAKLSYLI
jgi:HD superfamily phosphohydrolase